MGLSQVKVPWLACPHCLRTLPVHEIDGEPQIFRHVRTCDGDEPYRGFVEASEAAGVDSSDWTDERDRFVIGRGDDAE